MKKRNTAFVSFCNDQFDNGFQTHFLASALFFCVFLSSCGFSNQLSYHKKHSAPALQACFSPPFLPTYSQLPYAGFRTEPVIALSSEHNVLNAIEPENTETLDQPHLGLGSRIVNWGRRFLGIRYRRAGKTPRGFDCSGFTRYIFAKFGVRLPPNSHAQSFLGQKVDRQDIKPGDLVFFGYKSKRKRRASYRVSHAAIAISLPGEPLKILHSASGRGIVITTVRTSRYWTRRFLFAKSVIKSSPKSNELQM